jgi:hypothetical protein
MGSKLCSEPPRSTSATVGPVVGHSKMCDGQTARDVLTQEAMAAFSYDTVRLLQDGYVALTLLNVAATTVACLAALWFGPIVGSTS